MAVYDQVMDSNDRAQSKYPFDEASTMLIDQHTVPCSLIYSMKLQVQNAVFPVFIGSLSSANETLFITVKDSRGLSIATASCVKNQQQVLFRDSYGNFCGSLMCAPQMTTFLQGLVQNAYGGTLQLSSSALIISPKVISCTCSVGYKEIQIDGVSYGANAAIEFINNVIFDLSDSDIYISVYGDKDDTYKDLVKLQNVNGIPMKGKSLLVKAQMLSDLRAVTDNGSITFTGVKDVT